MERILFWVLFCLFFLFLGYFTVYYFDKQIEAEEHAAAVDKAYMERREHLLRGGEFYLIDEAEAIQ